MARTHLDPKLLKKLSVKLSKEIKYIREQIAKRASRNNVSSEAYFIYWLGQERIGAMRYYRSLPLGIQNEIRDLQNTLRAQAITSLSTTQKHKLQKIEKIFQIENLKIKQRLPLLPKRIINQAVQNSQIYPALFIFENSVRNLIVFVLNNEYGSNWWKAKVNKKIRDTVSERIQKERLNPWQGTRGAEPIFYTDFSDLAKILRSTARDFNPIFKGTVGGLNWLTHRLDELAVIRHNIAHTCPLKSKDRRMLLLYFQNFYDLLDILNERINNL